jgi:hypothetical protein
MPSEASTIGDPFADPITEVARAEAITETTLVVGRSATLTLGTDSLIVLGRWHLHARADLDFNAQP